MLGKTQKCAQKYKVKEEDAASNCPRSLARSALKYEMGKWSDVREDTKVCTEV